MGHTGAPDYKLRRSLQALLGNGVRVHRAVRDEVSGLNWVTVIVDGKRIHHQFPPAEQKAVTIEAIQAKVSALEEAT